MTRLLGSGFREYHSAQAGQAGGGIFEKSEIRNLGKEKKTPSEMKIHKVSNLYVPHLRLPVTERTQLRIKIFRIIVIATLIELGRATFK